MHRRDFLVTSAVTLGLGNQLSSLATRTSQPILMGLGDLGAEVVEHLALAGKLTAPWIWNDRPPQPTVPGLQFARVQRATFSHRRAKMMISHLLAERLGDFSTWGSVRLVVGLGGVVGSGIVAPLAELLEDRCTRVEIYCSFPGGEGPLRRWRMQRAWAALESHRNVVFVNLWSVPDGRDRSRRMEEAVDPTRAIPGWDTAGG